MFAVRPQTQVREEFGCDFELKSSVLLFRCLLTFDSVAGADFIQLVDGLGEWTKSVRGMATNCRTTPGATQMPSSHC